jgi:hypothetical protein
VFLFGDALSSANSSEFLCVWIVAGRAGFVLEPLDQMLEVS